MSAPTRTLLALALVLAGCGPQPRVAMPPAPPPGARVEATLQLPHGDGRVHVVVIPTGYLEASRCVIAVAAGGAMSTSCTARDLDLPHIEEQ